MKLAARQPSTLGASNSCQEVLDSDTTDNVFACVRVGWWITDSRKRLWGAYAYRVVEMAILRNLPVGANQTRRENTKMPHPKQQLSSAIPKRVFPTPLSLALYGQPQHHHWQVNRKSTSWV